MYWTDNGQPARIEKAAMDGTNRSVVITFDFDTSPTGLTIDSNGWLLFILVMNFPGWNITIITMIPSHNNATSNSKSSLPVVLLFLMLLFCVLIHVLFRRKCPKDCVHVDGPLIT